MSGIFLLTIFFTITKLVGTITLHVANKSYMQYTLKCMEPTVFNWSEAILSHIKEQLNKEKGGRKQNLSYGSILISFTLERIPLMQPQHVTLDIASPRYPRMQIWVGLMSWHASQYTIVFLTAFFAWFQ